MEYRFFFLGQCSAVAVGDFIYVFIHGYYLVRYCPTRDLYVRLGDSFPLPQWVWHLNYTIFLSGFIIHLCIYFIYKCIYAYMFMHLCLCIHEMYQCIYAVCRYVDGVRTYRYCFATSPFTCMYVCTYACMHVLICILYLMLVITDQGFYRVHPYCIVSTYISSSHA